MTTGMFNQIWTKIYIDTNGKRFANELGRRDYVPSGMKILCKFARNGERDSRLQFLVTCVLLQKRATCCRESVSCSSDRGLVVYVVVWPSREVWCEGTL